MGERRVATVSLLSGPFLCVEGRTDRDREGVREVGREGKRDRDRDRMDKAPHQAQGMRAAPLAPARGR